MRKSLYCIITVLSFPLFSANVYKTDIKTDSITSAEWEWHSGSIKTWPSFCVRFMPNGSIEAVSKTYNFAENASVFKGSYTITDDTSITGTYTYYSAYDTIPPDPNFKPKQNNFKAKINVSDNSVQYYVTLQLNNSVILVSKAFLVPEGINRKITDTGVITMGCKKGILNDNAKIRSKPDLSATIIPFCNSMESPALQFCPKGSEVMVLARTQNKEMIKEWNNYWYYVEISGNWEQEARYGWIFAEFIDIY